MARLIGRIYLTLLMLTGSCASHLCSIHATAKAPLPVQTPKKVTTAQWMMLLLRGPSHTCLGESIVPESAAPKGMRARPQPSHLFVADAGRPGVHIVWLQTHELGSTLFGPVAVVRGTGDGFVVEAMGTLQSEAGHTQLRLASEPAGGALWALSKRCQWHKALARYLCQEQLQILPRVGHTFAASLGAPRIDLLRQEASPLAAGWFRLVEQRIRCDVGSAGLVLQEIVCIKELSPRSPNVAPRNRRQAQNRRTLAFAKESGWAVPEQSLWDRM